MRRSRLLVLKIASASALAVAMAGPALPGTAVANARVNARANARSNARSGTRKAVLTAKARPVSRVHIPAGDEAVTGRGDTSGWHLYAASSGSHWRWLPLATLQPAGYGEEGWIGAQCLTGDGRYVIAVVAPWHVQNSAAGMASGALAYAVNAHTGAVRPLAAGVSLAYFNPGCGAGSKVALTRFGGQADQTTQVLVANAGTGRITSTRSVRGEVTSAVPVGTGVVGAFGGELVRLDGDRMHPISRVPGQAFSLRPNDAGGVDFLSAPLGGKTATVWREAAGHDRQLGTGPLQRMRLLGGRAGRTIVVGATRLVARSGLRVIAASSQVPVDGVSLSGTVTQSPPIGSPGRFGPLMLAEPLRTAGAGRLVTARLPRSVAPTTTVVPGERPVTARTVRRTSPSVTAPPGSTDPTACAVPRSNPAIQVPQPTSAQVDWAISKAVSGGLTGSQGRPANFDHLGFAAYSPSTDFKLPALAGGAGKPLPREVLDGIFAQESNYNQASWHATAGVPGDPLIADYYGFTASGGDYIDYDQADCGYGLGQLTTMMTNSQTASITLAKQQKVAVDFAENTAAAAQVLATTWNTLAADGITAGANPSVIEDWYFAIWAYNSGIEPTAQFGNTTGCNPGPSCTDTWGNWGVGWTNNPANPMYSPQRHPFLHLIVNREPEETYSDAAQPQEWPYQEKVFGWMETAQLDDNGDPEYHSLFNWGPDTGSFLTLPGIYDMCDNSSTCLPFDSTGQYCQLTPHNSTQAGDQYHCWFHDADNFCATASTPCHSSTAETGVPASDPGYVDPYPPACNPNDAAQPPNDPFSLPSSAIIVDDEATDQNLAGCATAPTTWKNGGIFAVNLGALAPDDWHQLGVGFGGHMWFTHTQSSDSENETMADWQVIGTWTPTLPAKDLYEIRVFVPDDGATTTHADYQVHPNSGSQFYERVVNQDAYGNSWVSLGFFPMGPGGYVTLANETPDSDGSRGADIAYDAIAFIPSAAGSYAAIGDSYSSGEGAGCPDLGPDESATDCTWDEGTDTANLSLSMDDGNYCHRTYDSFPDQYAHFSGTFPNSPVVHLACSGSNIYDLDEHIVYEVNHDGTICYKGAGKDPLLLANGQKDTSCDNPNDEDSATPSPISAGTNYFGEPASQLDLLKDLANKPKVLTVSIGANDANFVNVLTRCAEDPFLNAGTCQHAFTSNNTSNVVTNTINGLLRPFTDLFSDLKTALPTTKIIVVLYPNIFLFNSTDPQLKVDCSDIYSTDRQWLISQISLMDQILTEAAINAGVNYLNEYSALAGHELCNQNGSYVNGPTEPIGDPSFDDLDFHPTALGYDKIATDLLGYLTNAGIF